MSRSHTGAARSNSHSSRSLAISESPWALQSSSMAGIRGQCIAAAAARAATHWPRMPAIEEPCSAHGLSEIANDRLLCELLRAAPVCDRDMERMLTALRRGLFDLATQDAASIDSDVLAFLCALAQQCFVNEHVWAASDQ